MSEPSLDRYIKIIDNEVLRITKNFADKNLSKHCIECADFKSDKYYEWDIGYSAYSVMFELPTLFKANIQEVYSSLTFYCPEYAEKAGITTGNFRTVFEGNCKKNIVYKDTPMNSNRGKMVDKNDIGYKNK